MLIIKLLIRIKIHIIHPIKRTRKEKADIKNINNEVLGKGERERENRFCKIGFPLAVKIISEGETAFRKNRLFPSDSPFPKIFAFIFLFCPLIQVYTDNKVVDADIKNKNNEVLGKGERERENRFYKIGFPLAVKIKKENR